ncbi:MAG: restriction endonuclease subunit S [Ignavibacterium sp.]
MRNKNNSTQMTQIKQIKKDKNSGNQSDQRHQRSIPPHWSWVKLGDVCKVKGGFAFKSKDYTKEGIPLVRISNIEDKEISLEDCVYIQPDDEEKVKEFLLHKGDILIALSGATTGKYGIYKLKQKALLNQRIGRLHFNGSDKIIPSFVYLYLEIIRYEILKTAYGAAQPNISPTEIAEFQIPLPPLHEQKKIVEKIEELFSSLDAGVAALKKAKEQLRLYRQSVLSAAFSGKLVNGERLNGIQVVNKAAESKVEYNNNGLPAGWKWVKLGDVSEEVEMVQKKNQNPEDEFVYYDIGGINNITNRIESFKRYKWKNAPSRARQIVMNGDILFSTVRTYLKNIALLNNEFEFQIASTGFCVIRPKNQVLISKYIFHYSLYKEFLEPLNALQTGSSYPAVRNNDVFNQKIPLPPLDQQHQIVSEIEKRFSQADNLEKAIDESLKKAEALRQSILKQAFEGKLI